jgi:hypothetical protein
MLVMGTTHPYPLASAVRYIHRLLLPAAAVASLRRAFVAATGGGGGEDDIWHLTSTFDISI